MSAVRFRRADDVLWRNAADSVVLLPLRHGELVNLTGSGGALWDVLDQPRTLDEVAATLSEAYGVPVEAVLPDLGLVIEQLERVAAVQRLEAS